MTPSEVADRLSISKAHLRELEKGEKSVTSEILEKYAQLFDMPISSLVFFSESISKNEKKIPRKFRSFISLKVLDVMEWLIEREEKAKIKA